MKTRSYVWLALIVLMWGTAFPLVKIALSEVQPITLGFIRFIIAAPILLLYSYFQDGRGLKAIFVRHPFPLILMGLSGVMSYQVFQNIGVKLTSATNSSIIISSDPIIIVVLSILFLKERMNRARASGVFLGFLGVLVIILSEGNSLSTASSSFFGDVLSLGAALSWSIYSVVGRKLAPQCTPMGLTAISSAFGTALLLPPMYFLESPRLPSTGQVWVAVLALSLGSTCVAYALWNKVLSEEEASKTGIALFLIPVVTAAFSVIFLSESLTLPMLFGTALVFSGIIISERVGAKWK